MATTEARKRPSVIMVVDDEKDILTITKKALEMNGYEVHAFDNPKLALQHAKDGCKTCSKVIISDIRMPGMTGFELVKQLKELHPHSKILLMTSFEIQKREFDKVFPSIQIEELIEKPFTISRLIEAVKKYGSGGGNHNEWLATTFMYCTS
jgi:two-component system nitrogen regulation response regulator GlnG